ncbi:MAG: MmgE/PrpD family protein [Rhodospirillaceae bacterium]|jgi:aconitate decarboxylase|nr:MmgE/PrpD family protein [Rhodospirillaceae bacterium]
MGVTADLCDKIVATTYGDLTDDAKDRARRLVIDGIAVAIAGTVQEEAPGVLAKHVRALGGEPQSTAIGFGFKTSPVQAAYLNGASMHVLDFEPMWSPANHQVSTSLPALLALAERDGASGREILTGIVKGTEMMGWLRQASRQIGRAGVRFHPPGLVGPLGSAVASSHILGLDSLTLRNALGIVSSRAGSIFANVGTMSKSINCGHAVAMGVDAALLAGHGFTANPNVLEAPNGYVESFFNEDFVLDDMLKFGPPYRVTTPGYAIKMFPSQFGTHFVITAALAIHKKIDGRSEDIEKIRLITPKMEYINRPRPETGLDGKFSWQYTTCCALLDGTVRMASFEDERRFRDDIEAMLGRVELDVRDDIVGAFEEMHVTVEVTMKDGSVHSETCDGPVGKYGRPPIPEDVHLVKVRDCLALKFDDAGAEKVIALARRIDDLDAAQIGELMGLLAC